MLGRTGLANEGRAKRRDLRRRTGWSLLASTALVAVPTTLTILSPSDGALANGGRGGSVNGAYGAAGVTSETGAGGNGQPGPAAKKGPPNGGGGGGAGVTGGRGGDSGGLTNAGKGGNSPGAAGLDAGWPESGNAAGGGGGAHGYVGATAPTEAVSGGAGGAGASGVKIGGGGGAGGYGAVLTGTDATTIQFNVTGGAGGKGGSTSVEAKNAAGAGGDGGLGLDLTGKGALITIADGVSVTGGNGGGASGSTPYYGAGGFGIRGTDLVLHLAPTATVTGGLFGDGKTRAEAIVLDGTSSVLEMQGRQSDTGENYATIIGNVTANNSGSTLKFTGDGIHFDLTHLDGNPRSLAQFRGFGTIEVATDTPMYVSHIQSGLAETDWLISRGSLHMGDPNNSTIIVGNVRVSSGTSLVIDNDQTSLTGKLIVQDGGTLSVDGRAGQTQFVAHSMSLLPGSSLNIVLGAPTQKPLLSVPFQAGFAGILNVTAATGFAAGAYPLIRSQGTFANGATSFSEINGPAGYKLSTILTEHFLTLQVDKANSPIATTLFWNGKTTTGDSGPVAGGSGTWEGAQGATNWTNGAGTSRLAYDENATPIFGGGPGIVNVSTAKGAVKAGGLTFQTDRYIIAGDPLTLASSAGTPKVTFSDPSFSATIVAPLQITGGVELVGGGTLILAGMRPHSGDVTITAGTLQIGDGTGATTLKGNITNSDRLIFTNSDATTFDGQITGSGIIEKRGPGALVMSNLPSTAGQPLGPTRVSEGTLTLAPASSNPAYFLSAVTLLPQATLSIRGQISVGSLTGAGSVTVDQGQEFCVGLDGSTTVFSGDLSGSGNFRKVGGGTLTLDGSNHLDGLLFVEAGQVVLSGARTLPRNDILDFGSVVFDTPDYDEYRGVISGPGGLEKRGQGTLLLSNFSPTKPRFTGSLAVKEGRLGLLSQLDRGFLPNAVTVSSGATLSIQGGAFFGSLDGEGAVTLFDGSTLEVGSRGATTEFSGSLTGAGSISKVGAGTLTLSGPNSFTGGLTVAAGQVVLSGGAAIDKANDVILRNGANLQITKGDASIGSLTSDGSGTGTVVLNGSNLTIGSQGASVYTGSIEGTGGLTKAGPGQLTLSGRNTFTGPVTVLSGILNSTSGEAMPDHAAVDVKPGAELRIFAKSQIIGSLSGGGTVVATGLAIDKWSADLVVGTNDASTTFSGRLADGLGGHLTLTKVGAGTLALTGDVAYTGSTRVQGGTLQVAGGVYLHDMTSVDAYATLVGDPNGSSPTKLDNLTLMSRATLQLTSGTTTFSSENSVVMFDSTVTQVNVGAPSATPALASHGNLDLAGTVRLTAKAGFDTGSHRLFNYDGSLKSSLVLEPNDSIGLAVLDTSTDHQVNLKVAALRHWRDNASAKDNAWRVAPSANWLNPFVSDGPGSWVDGSVAVFDDQPATVRIGGTSPFVAGMRFLRDGYLVKEGAIQLSNIASYSGPVPIVVEDSNSSTGGVATIATNLVGSAGLVKLGKGTLTLAGAAIYNGATTVAAGTLNVTGAIQSNNGTSVAPYATLTGSGLVRDVTVEHDGILMGVQGQTLTTGNLVLNDSSHVAVRLGSGGPALFQVNGNLTLNGAKLDVTSATGTIQDGLYRIVNYTGSLKDNGLTPGYVESGQGWPSLALKSDPAAKTIDLVVNPSAVTVWNSGGANNDGTLSAKTFSDSGNGRRRTTVFHGQPGLVMIDTQHGPVVIGGLQFASGGYQINGGPITLAPPSGGPTIMRVGDGTLNGRSVVATISSVITGAGTLQKSDAGTLLLTAPNTYSGGTSVEMGTLQLGHPQSAGTGPISLNEGTTLSFIGAMRLMNLLRFPQRGDPIIDTGADTVTMDGEIAGVGDLSKIGTGTLVLSATESYTGATDVVAGTLVATGSLASSSGVTVEDGATLGGSGTVPNLSVLAGATVAPGVATPFSTLNVAGSVTFAAGSTFRVQIDAAGRTDAISATGTATLAGGTVDVLAGEGIYARNRSYRILNAAGGRNGQFADLHTTTNLAFLQPSLSYDATGVSLGFARAAEGTADTGHTDEAGSPTETGSGSGTSGKGGTSGKDGTSGKGGTTDTGGTPDTGGTGSTAGTGSDGGSVGPAERGGKEVVRFPSVAASANQRAAAWALEALGRGRVFDAVLSQSAAGARQAFDAVSGEIHAGALTAAIEDTRVVRDSIIGRLQEADAEPASGPVLWGNGFGTFGRNGGDGDAARLKRSLGGFVIGADNKLDAPGLSEWRLGVAGGYTEDTFSLGLRSSRGEAKMVFGGLYAGALYGPLDLKLGVLGGGTQITTQRTVLFPGFMDSTRSRSEGSVVQGFGEVGYRITLPQGFVEPVIQGAMIRVGQDGVRETGGAAALRVFARSAEVATTTLGIRSEASLSEDWPLIARGFVGWRHAYSEVAPQALAAFTSGGTAFAVTGTPIDRNAAVAEVGLDYRASSALTLGLSYSAQVGARASDQSVRGRLEYRF